MAWLAANPDGKFKIFNFKPKRCIEPITKEIWGNVIIIVEKLLKRIDRKLLQHHLIK